VHPRRVDSLTFVFSLSSHRYPYVVFFLGLPSMIHNKQQSRLLHADGWDSDKYPRVRFQRGDWKVLWETALRLSRKESDDKTKRKHNCDRCDTSSIQARVVYADHCAHQGGLSKANQAVTSNSLPNANPTNIDLLRVKHPDATHPDSDPVKVSSIL
jgi:hypothetical protein